MRNGSGWNATRACIEHSVLTSGPTARASLVLYACLGVVGVLGNAHVILVFRSSRERSLRFLVLLLTCLDLIISGIILPLDLYRVYTELGGHLHWHFLGTVILSSRQAAFELEGCVLMLIAVDRYLCVVRARRDGLSFRRAVVALAASSAVVVVMETGNVITHYLIEYKCEIKNRLETYLLYFYGGLGSCSIVVVAALYARILSFVAAIERRRSSRREITRRTLRSLTRRCGSSSGGDGGRRSGSSRGVDSSAMAAPPYSPTPRRQADDATDFGDSSVSCGGANGISDDGGCQRSSIVRFGAERGPSATTAAPSVCASAAGYDDADDEAFHDDAEVDAAAASAPSGATWFPLRLALMLFGASVLFYLSLLPGILINFRILPDSPLHRLIYLNSSLNFAVYALLNPKFRSDLRCLYSKHCRL